MLKSEIFERFFKLIENDIYTINLIEIVYYDYEGIFHGKHKSLQAFKNEIKSLQDLIIFEIYKKNSDNLRGIKSVIQKYLDSFSVYEIDNKKYRFHALPKIFEVQIETEQTLEKKLIETGEDTRELIQNYESIKETYCKEIIEIIDKELNTKSINSNTTKLMTTFSVGELSLLFRLLNEEGKLKIKTNTELYRFIAAHFSSTFSNVISDKSIKNKFLSPDNTAIKNLDILLVNLRQQLKKIQ